MMPGWGGGVERSASLLLGTGGHKWGVSLDLQTAAQG